jgi:hypothetical protein
MDESTKQALEHGSKALENLTDLVNKLAGPLAEEMGLSLGQKAYEYRVRNATKILSRVKQMLSEAGIEPSRIPSRFFLPAMQAASVEDDATLQEKWAALLTNAADPKQSVDQPSFVEVLKQLTPEEVRFLDKVASSLTERLNAGPVVMLGSFMSLGSIFIDNDHERWARLNSDRHFHMMLDNLIRLGILGREDPSTPMGAIIRRAMSSRTESQLKSALRSGVSDLKDRDYFLTTFGSSFLSACRAPSQSAQG